MIGHRLLGNSLLCVGDFAEGLAHLDRALALYDPAAHRPLATRFGQDVGVAILSFRPFALWMLGYPGTALAEAVRPLNAAREMGHAPTLMFALFSGTLTRICCGDYAAASTQVDECAALAEEKGSEYFKVFAAAQQGCVLALTGQSSIAVQAIGSALIGYRSVGGTVWSTSFISCLAWAYADLGKFDEAWRYVGEAMTVVETTKERWFEAECNRIAGEIALKSPEQDVAKAETYFDRALAVARRQQAKSWELRSAMSLARLWRDQGKTVEARELLASVYSWFTEGFDTRDLKDAKALLEDLASGN
jgi:predicted ATPase